MSDAEKLELVPQRQLAASWTEVVPSFPSENIHVLPSIEHALRVIRSFEADHTEIQVLVSGSLHLVGGVIEVANLASVALGSGSSPKI